MMPNNASCCPFSNPVCFPNRIYPNAAACLHHRQLHLSSLIVSLAVFLARAIQFSLLDKSR